MFETFSGADLNSNTSYRCPVARSWKRITVDVATNSWTKSVSIWLSDVRVEVDVVA